MRRRLLIGVFALFAAVTPSVSAAELPSGLKVDLNEVLVDQVGEQTWLRFRFIAPEIDRSNPNAVSFDAMEADFQVICRALALPYAAKYDLPADVIVISVADRVVKFGTTDPDATQYFEQFRAENGDCIWEAF